MNVKERNALWIKIRNFPLDEKDVAINFSQKLATLQKWSPAFTKRVIEEYRKFIFLCCIAENGASPSNMVDEAWHLHLTYTKSYWVDFCKNTLNKEIHHHPSKGGADENHKHEDWYKETLQLYKTVFGLAPPTDIWPRPLEYTTEINIADSSTGNKIIWAAALPALPFLFTGFVYQTFNPFHLNGPEFLVFYLLFGIVIITSFIVLQNGKGVEQATAANFPDDTTIFQIAKFLYGKHRAVQTAIVDLIRRDLIKVNADKSMVVLSDHYVPTGKEENPLIGPLMNQPNGSKVNYEEIAADWYRDEQFAHPALDRLYLLANRDTPFFQKGIFYVVLIATGVLRLMQGTYNHRPVVFLFFEMLGLGIGLYIVADMLSTGKRLFKKAEALFKEKLRQQKGYKDQVVNDFVINGTPAIAGFAEGFLLASVFTAYTPLAHRVGWDSTGSCSGGGSSCSGGSSCGGGGCGGCGGGGD